MTEHLTPYQGLTHTEVTPIVAEPASANYAEKIDELLKRAINPQEVCCVNGEQMALEDVPSASLRALLGYGHEQPFYREVINRPDGVSWSYTPNMCLIAGEIKGVWIDEDHLVCAGCGLGLHMIDKGIGWLVGLGAFVVVYSVVSWVVR